MQYTSTQTRLEEIRDHIKLAETQTIKQAIRERNKYEYQLQNNQCI